MLLLHRHRNDSVVIHKDGEPDNPIVVRVCEVLPTGDVTLGFIGDNYKVIRQEIYSAEPLNKRGDELEKNERRSTNEKQYGGYYS